MFWRTYICSIKAAYYYIGCSWLMTHWICFSIFVLKSCKGWTFSEKRWDICTQSLGKTRLRFYNYETCWMQFHTSITSQKPKKCKWKYFCWRFIFVLSNFKNFFFPQLHGRNQFLFVSGSQARSSSRAGLLSYNKTGPDKGSELISKPPQNEVSA